MSAQLNERNEGAHTQSGARQVIVAGVDDSNKRQEEADEVQPLNHINDKQSSTTGASKGPLTYGDIVQPTSHLSAHGPIFTLHPETVRLVAYVAFWIMVLLAFMVTSIWVNEDLSNSPLVQMFGYNNVCILWDYEPAASVIAMFYPAVEIPLVIYMVLNFIRVWELYNSGRFPMIRFAICMIMAPIELILILWFRMIFVVKAFTDVKGHTLGFHGLMIALCCIAFQNFLYHDSIGKLPGSRWMSISYLTLLISVTSFKMIVAWSIFGGTPLWDVHTTSGQSAGHFLDVTWMVLASVVPAFIAYKNRRATPAMVLSYAIAPVSVGVKSSATVAPISPV